MKILFQNTVVAHAHTGPKGNFTASFVVPTNAQIGFQNNGIVASGKTSGIAASAFFSVEPNVYITPRIGTNGTLITVEAATSHPTVSRKSYGSTPVPAAPVVPAVTLSS